MIDKNISVQEIQHELNGKGDYVKIDYLSRLLKETISIASRNFVCQKLAEIYEDRGMLPSAAQMYEALGISALTSGDKVKYFTKETECYAIAGSFDKADYALKRAMSEGNPIDRQRIYDNTIETFKKYASQFEKEKNKRNHAAKIYEKLLEMKIPDSDRKTIKEKLLQLYEQMGKMKEYFQLKNMPEKIMQKNKNDVDMFNDIKNYNPSRDQFSENKERRFLGIDGLDI